MQCSCSMTKLNAYILEPYLYTGVESMGAPAPWNFLMDVHIQICHAVAVSTVKECTSGFLDTLNAEDYNSRQLSPLLGSFGSSVAEQWIFPSLRFTCSGRLAKWIYRPAHPQVQVSMECRINIATWRLDGSSFGTVYRKWAQQKEYSAAQVMG